MSARLIPCPSCSRHVRAEEASCPFCSAALTGLMDAMAAAPAPQPPPAGLSRAGIFLHGTRGAKALAGAVVGTSLLAAGCSNGNSLVAAYGIACDVDACTFPMDAEVVLADAHVSGSDAADDVEPSDDGSSPTDGPTDAPHGGDGSSDTGPHDGSPAETSVTDAPHG
jgi:hypothetical protein